MAYAKTVNIRLYLESARGIQQATWLLVSTDPHDPDLAFGLSDLGLGVPELGDVSMRELENVHGAFGLAVERDLHFVPSKSLLEYAQEASETGRIVT